MIFNSVNSSLSLTLIRHSSCHSCVFKSICRHECLVTSGSCDLQCSLWWCATTFSVTNTARGNYTAIVLHGLWTGTTERRSYLKKFSSTMPTSSVCRSVSAEYCAYKAGWATVVVKRPSVRLCVRPDELLSCWSVPPSVCVSIRLSAFHINHFFSHSCQPVSVLFILCDFFFNPVLVFKVLRLSLKPG